MSDYVVEIVSAVAVGILALSGKKLKEKLIQLLVDFAVYLQGPRPHTIDSVEVSKHKSVSDMLLMLMTSFNADRAYIIEFHNGATFSSNAPIWKMSCTYEHCRAGISYTAPLLQNVLMSSVIDIVSALWDKPTKGVTLIDCKGCKDTSEGRCPLKGVYEYDVAELTESSGKALLRIQGIEHVLITPLVSGGQIIGMLCADFCSGYERPEDLHEFCQEATTISFLVSQQKG